jgi:hypothetical protein
MMGMRRRGEVAPFQAGWREKRAFATSDFLFDIERMHR